MERKKSHDSKSLKEKLANAHLVIGELEKRNEELEAQIEDKKHDVELEKIKARLAEVFESEDQAEVMANFLIHRNNLLDNFRLAYMAEMELLPSQVKLVQRENEHGEIELFFDKNSKIITEIRG
jgi:ribosomal protein S3